MMQVKETSSISRAEFEIACRISYREFYAGVRNKGELSSLIYIKESSAFYEIASLGSNCQAHPAGTG